MSDAEWRLSANWFAVREQKGDYDNLQRQLQAVASEQAGYEKLIARHNDQLTLVEAQQIKQKEKTAELYELLKQIDKKLSDFIEFQEGLNINIAHDLDHKRARAATISSASTTPADCAPNDQPAAEPLERDPTQTVTTPPAQSPIVVVSVADSHRTVPF